MPYPIAFKHTLGVLLPIVLSCVGCGPAPASVKGTSSAQSKVAKPSVLPVIGKALGASSPGVRQEGETLSRVATAMEISQTPISAAQLESAMADIAATNARAQQALATAQDALNQAEQSRTAAAVEAANANAALDAANRLVADTAVKLDAAIAQVGQAEKQTQAQVDLASAKAAAAAADAAQAQAKADAATTQASLAVATANAASAQGALLKAQADATTAQLNVVMASASAATNLAASASSSASLALARTQATVKEYGAKGDGANNDTAAVQSAIDACAAGGGGQVVFPPGTYSVGDFTYPANVTLEGQGGSALLIAGQRIPLPQNSQTYAPMQFYVSTTGKPTNHGLSASCPFDRISTALRRLPKNLFHEVVIKVADGTYTEGGMIDEWGRPTGLVIDGLNVHPERIAPDAVFPDALSWQRNKKGAKLSIVGSGSDGVIIQGRPDGTPYQDGVTPRTGLISRVRDFYLFGVTIKNYDTDLLAHEGGAISGWDVKLLGSSNVALMVESQTAKVDIGALNVQATGGYCVRVSDGQASFNNNSRLYVGSNGPGILAEHSLVDFQGTITSLDGVTIKEGVRGVNSEVSVTGTVDHCSLINDGGKMLLNAATVKNSGTAIQNRNGSLEIGGGSHIFGNQVGVLQQSGLLTIQNSDSLDGAVQSSNSVAGVRVVGGYFRYSPYDVTTLKSLIKGIAGAPETNVMYGNGVQYPIENCPESSAQFSATGWPAGNLGSNLNVLLNKARAPIDPTQGTTLYAAWQGIVPLASYNVLDCNNQLNSLVTALFKAGLIADASKYTNTATANSQLDHDRVKIMFNVLLSDLIKFGYMKPGGITSTYDLIKSPDGSRYVIMVDDSGLLTTKKL